jgi:hypothetical protein
MHYVESTKTLQPGLVKDFLEVACLRDDLVRTETAMAVVAFQGIGINHFLPTALAGKRQR